MLREYIHVSFLKDLVGQASCPLELVYSDICRSMTTPSVGGAKYLFSPFLWMYTIPSKDDAFRDFKSLVENHNNHMIKSIRIDHGDGYFGDAFHSFLTSLGIVW
jgi:hypothetical protein